MIFTALNIIIIIFAFFAISRALLRYRDKKLSLSATIFWILTWSAIVVLSFFRERSDYLANIAGISRGPDLIFLLATIALLYLVFRLYVKIESIDHNMTTIIIELSKQKRVYRKQDKKN